MDPITPPLLVSPERVKLSRRAKLLIAAALVPAFLVGVLLSLRLLGLVRPFYVPTGSMAPAVCAGDHVMMEGVTFLERKPRRGDVVVFKTDGLALLPPADLHLKRIAGEPGEHLVISEGRLFVNQKPISLSHAVGEIVYRLPAGMAELAPVDLTVPEDSYFVLGDNSTNSLDSRYFGCVPGRQIIGRLWFCCWPPGRMAHVK
jgi:signal peptidase I